MYPFNFSNIVYVLFANITCISYHNLYITIDPKFGQTYLFFIIAILDILE